MCTGEDIIVTLAEARSTELSPAEETIAASLRVLAPDTIRRQALRFKRYNSELSIGVPTSKAARRTLKSALRLGLMLNCLHPDHAVSAKWFAIFESGGLKEIWAGRILEDGSPDFYNCLELATHKRRRRLSKLPPDWFCHSLKLAERCIDSLQAAILVMALSGCRPCELSGIHVKCIGDYVHLKIKCAKDRDEDRSTAPRYRVLHLNKDSGISNWVSTLQHLIGVVAFPFKEISPKSVENALARLSITLLNRSTEPLNASCYRNQFCADLKRDGMTDELTAYYMGHISTRTKSHYGTFNQGVAGRRGYLVSTENFREKTSPRQHLTPSMPP